MIHIEKKKEFIRVLLSEYVFKRREVVFLLNFMYQNEDILEKTHFVDDPENLNNVLIMKTRGSKTDEPDFNFIADDEIILDVEEAFKFIKDNKERDYYVVIIAKNLFDFESYVEVLEENSKANLPAEYGEIADEIIEKIQKDFQIKYIREKIDEAIDNNDREAFLKYSNELNKYYAAQDL